MNRMGPLARFALTLSGAVVLGSCGGGTRQAALPQAAPAARAAAPASARITIVVPRPGATRVRVPRTVSPSIQSLLIAASNGAITIPSTVNLTPQSPNCSSASGGLSCTAAIPVPAGNDTFTFRGYDGPGGSGQIVSTAQLVALMRAGAPNVVNVTLNTVVGSIALALVPSILTVGSSSSATLLVQGTDADGNAIVGPGPYLDANGLPVSIAVTLTDTFGVTTLSANSVTSPANAALTIAYNGTVLPIGSSVQLSALSSSTPAVGATAALGFGSSGLALYAVGGFNSNIAAFVPGQSGNVPPLRQILATLTFAQDVTTDAAGYLYVSDANGGSYDRIQVYSPGAFGNATPLRTISGAATGLISPLGVLIDSLGNLWVSNQGGASSSVTVYAPGAAGNAAPLGAIKGVATALSNPARMLFDPSGNLIVANQSAATVLTFSAAQVAAVRAGATLNAAPALILSGANTNLQQPAGVALDGAGNLYVSNETSIGRITVYAPPFSGNVFPIRNIGGTSNAVTQLGNPIGLAFDAGGNLIVATNGGAGPVHAKVLTFSAANISSSPPGNGSIAPSQQNLAPDAILNEPYLPNYSCFDGVRLTAARMYVVDDCMVALWEFPLGASGNAPPLQSILPPHVYEDGLGSDAAGNLWVAGGNGFVSEFAPGASGYAQPLRVIGGANSQLGGAAGVGFDASGNVYVTSRFPNLVAVFPPSANGNVAPLRTIAGTATGLNQPTGSPRFDGAGNLYVANAVGNSITVYAPGASGNAAPLRTLGPGNSGLANPQCIAFDGSGNLYVLNTGAMPSASITQYSLAEITAIPAGTTGSPYAIRTIQGPSTSIGGGGGACLSSDAGGNVFTSSSGAGYRVLSFSAAAIAGIAAGTGAAPGGVGNLTPSTNISGANTTIQGTGPVLLAP